MDGTAPVGALAQGPMPISRHVADFRYPPRTRCFAERPRSRAGRHAAAGGLTFARATRNAHIAGGRGLAALPIPVQVSSRAAVPLEAARREDGLVFSLGLSYGRGRAFSALGATATGPMRRISREA